MSTSERFEDRVDQVSGKTKEWAGKVTDDERLESEGRTQHEVAETKSDLRDAGDHMRDAGQKVKEAFQR